MDRIDQRLTFLEHLSQVDLDPLECLPLRFVNTHSPGMNQWKLRRA
jgi:hypothetical protein